MSQNTDSPIPPTPSDVDNEDQREIREALESPVGEFENAEELLGDMTVHEDEDEEGEELFGDNMENDYRPIPELDRYDEAVLDDEDDYSVISASERRAAEEEMRRRDRALGIVRDDRELLYDRSDDEDDIPRAKRRAAEKAAMGGELEDEEMVESIENLEDTKGHSTKEWVSMLAPRTEITNRFKNFLRTFVDDNGHLRYRERIKRMCEQNQSSFTVSYPEARLLLIKSCP
uniref:MCM N-terminal domain-containing protein n=1 Tax=Phlebotomus papatasi TaxID=29031 RepID=A0A1B0D774_PHLPP